MTYSKTFLSTFLVIVALLVLCSSSSAALLDGKTINYQYYYPNLSSPYSSAGNGNYVVGSGVEITYITDYYNLGTIDISDSNIYVHFDMATSFSQGVFNGFQITDINGNIDTITSVSINAATNMTGLTADRITFDADHIWVNWQSLPFGEGTVVSLDVNGSAQVPEPSVMFLVGCGLVGLAGLRQKFAHR